MAAVLEALPRVISLAIANNKSVRVTLASAKSSHTFTSIGEASICVIQCTNAQICGCLCRNVMCNDTALPQPCIPSRQR